MHRSRTRPAFGTLPQFHGFQDKSLRYVLISYVTLQPNLHMPIENVHIHDTHRLKATPIWVFSGKSWRSYSLAFSQLRRPDEGCKSFFGLKVHMRLELARRWDSASARVNFVSVCLNRQREDRGHVSCVIAVLKELGVVCCKANESRSQNVAKKKLSGTDIFQLNWLLLLPGWVRLEVKAAIPTSCFIDPM